jgi:hypothetical protein
MEAFNKTAAKAGKELSSATSHSSRKTQAKENLDDARNERQMDKEAGSEKKLKIKPETEIK